jgi:hypothetical protein
MGLKEAKDMYERLDPTRSGGLIGPIRTNVPLDHAHGLLSQFGAGTPGDEGQAHITLK